MNAEAKLTADEIRNEIINAAKIAVARAAAAQAAAARAYNEQVPTANDAQLVPTLSEAVTEVGPQDWAPAAPAPAVRAAPAATAERSAVAPSIVAEIAAARAAVTIPATPALAAKAKARSTQAAPAKAGKIPWPLFWTVVVAAVLGWGYYAHLERFISPKSGTGYWLGIVGGSLMVLLLLYSARKRASWLRWMGAIPAWFEFHMVLGVVGPVMILFHSNFSLGATNSNVALFSMLLVAGSGVVGRYIYTRLHANLDGKADSLEEMKAVGDRLRAQTTSIEFLPGLLDAIDSIERRLIEPPKSAVARFVHLFTGALRMARARYLVRREIKAAVEKAIRRESPVVAKHAQRIANVARSYAYRRLDAGRRVSEYRAYAQLFSLWHVLHIPLFFMLLIAGIAHVIAVNVY